MKKRKMRSNFSLLLAVSLLLALLAGCNSGSGNSRASDTSSGNNKSGNVIELTYWMMTDYQDAVQPITEAFNQSSGGIKVTVTYFGSFASLEMASTSGKLPDMWFNGSGSYGKYFTDNGYAYDLSNYADENGWWEKFNSAALTACDLGGQLAGYPTGLDVEGVFYNKSVFEQFSLEEPTTLDELEDLSATLVENGITPFSTAGQNWLSSSLILEQLIEYYADAELHDQLQTMTTSWKSDAVDSALTTFRDWCASGYFPTTYMTDEYDKTTLSVIEGTCAMEVKDMAFDRDILSGGASVDDFGWFPFPNGTGRSAGYVELTQMNADLSDQELEACVTYLDYVFSNENAEEYSDIFVLPLATTDAAISDSTPHVAEVLDYANEHGTFNITYLALPETVFDHVYSNLNMLYSGSVTPSEAAATIQDAIEVYQKKS